MEYNPGNTDKFLRGKRIAISGAGRGLGRALAIVAADHGADTVLLGRDQLALDEVAATISTRTERRPLAVVCDLASPSSIHSAYENVLNVDATVDVLINNGAPWSTGNLIDLSDDDIVATVAAAVTGTILLTKKLLPALRQSAAADIITIVSTSAIFGNHHSGGSTPFFAAKHGQSGFSDKLRHELRNDDIRVSAIYPPDFDDADPTDPSWENRPSQSAMISNREIVSIVLFILASSRACSFPAVFVERMALKSN